MQAFALESVGFIQRIEFGMQRIPYLERGQFASKACVNFGEHNSLKVKCEKNWYWDVSSCVLRTLKGFCMAKSTVDLDVKIVLSKYRFIGVAAFANI